MYRKNCPNSTCVSQIIAYAYRKPSNNVSGILIETHETPFFGSTLRRIKWDMKHKNILTYSLDFALSKE